MINTVRDQLSSSGLFQSFPEDAKQKLESLCRVQRYRNDEVIYHKGDNPIALYGVVEGAVKLIGEAPTGKFFLYELVSPGQWFGENAAIDGEKRGQTALVVGEAKIISLLRRDLLELLDQQPDLYKHFVDVLCARLRRAGKALEEAAFLPVGIRMAKILLRMHRVRDKYSIKLSQEEISASLGVTRQSIYRELKNWRQSGWVSVDYGNVKLEDPAALQLWIDTDGRSK